MSKIAKVLTPEKAISPLTPSKSQPLSFTTAVKKAIQNKEFEVIFSELKSDFFQNRNSFLDKTSLLFFLPLPLELNPQDIQNFTTEQLTQTTLFQGLNKNEETDPLAEETTKDLQSFYSAAANFLYSNELVVVGEDCSVCKKLFSLTEIPFRTVRFVVYYFLFELLLLSLKEKKTNSADFLFINTFPKSFRDVSPEIRKLTASVLHKMANKYEAFFFVPEKLKFAGWLLSDRFAPVRKKAIEIAAEFTSSESDQKEKFFAKFAERLFQMSNDKNAAVVTAVLNSLDSFAKAVSKKKTTKKVWELLEKQTDLPKFLLDKNSNIRGATQKLLQRTWIPANKKKPTDMWTDLLSDLKEYLSAESLVSGLVRAFDSFPEEMHKAEVFEEKTKAFLEGTDDCGLLLFLCVLASDKGKSLAAVFFPSVFDSVATVGTAEQKRVFFIFLDKLLDESLTVCLFTSEKTLHTLLSVAKKRKCGLERVFVKFLLKQLEAVQSNPTVGFAAESAIRTALQELVSFSEENVFDYLKSTNRVELTLSGKRVENPSRTNLSVECLHFLRKTGETTFEELCEIFDSSLLPFSKEKEVFLSSAASVYFLGDCFVSQAFLDKSDVRTDFPFFQKLVVATFENDETFFSLGKFVAFRNHLTDLFSTVRKLLELEVKGLLKIYLVVNKTEQFFEGEEFLALLELLPDCFVQLKTLAKKELLECLGLERVLFLGLSVYKFLWERVCAEEKKLVETLAKKSAQTLFNKGKDPALEHAFMRFLENKLENKKYKFEELSSVLKPFYFRMNKSVINKIEHALV